MQILKIFIISIGLLSMSDSEIKQFPEVELFTLDGKQLSSSDMYENGPVVVSLWATWCAPCKRELDHFSDRYDTWKEEYGAEVIAISVDNARGLRKVPAMVASKGWEFSVLADKKGALMELMGLSSIPQTYVINDKGDIVYDQNGYVEGSEDDIEEILKNLAK